MILAPDLIGKIGKLIPRLPSDHEGEVVATVRAIQRTLQTAGRDLHDVVATLEKPPVERVVEKVVYRDRAVPTQSATHQPDFDPAEIPRAKVVELAEKLLDPQWCELTPSQADFVGQMLRWAKSRRRDFSMSPKQTHWFRCLVDQHLGLEIRP